MATVLITGSAQRLGRSIALMLAQSGWDVAIHYGKSQEEAIQLVEELCAFGINAQAFQADLAHERACQSLLDSVIKTMGEVKAVINNASLFDYDDGLSFNGRILNQHMQVNLTAPVILAQALFQHRRELTPQIGPNKGVVVNLLDQKLWNLNPDHFSYTLSKAALQTATQMLAVTLAPHVRVVGVAPGLTLPSKDMSEPQFHQLHQLAPLGASSKPEDIAKTVAFVLENEAITGTTLLVDGGQHLIPMERDFSFMNKKTI